MTRIEEIIIAADEAFPTTGRNMPTFEMLGFISGAKWADNNPKSPWISVKDNLPCNHKELILNTKCHTVNVFTYKKGGACGIDNMIIRNGKWEWEAWKENYLYWMPIPNLPK